jgi:DNA polymerase-1
MSQRERISHKLEDVAWRELGLSLEKDHQKANWSGDLTEEMLVYAATDTKVLLPLAEILGSKIQKAGLDLVAEIERRALPAMAWMSGAGVPFDAVGWRGRLEAVEEEKDRLEQQLGRLAPSRPGGKPWNWNSHRQITEAFGLLGLDLPNTQVDTLRRCDHPLAEALVEHREASKVLSTYGSSLLEKVENGRIYGSWHQIGARTGRMTCSGPNLQNLPPEVRKHVRVPEGKTLIKADYSQAELRIAAKVSGDEVMLEAYRNGEDLHVVTARGLFGRENVSEEERKLAKAINFGLLYGQGAPGLRDYVRNKADIEMTPEQSHHYRQRFFRTYPGLRAWHRREWNAGKRGSTETRTLTGRRRTGVRSFTERLNAPVQGTGADGLKLALAQLWERRDKCPEAVPIVAVHDEIVVECEHEIAEKAAAWLENAMVSGMEVALAGEGSDGSCVPVGVEIRISKTWAR